MKNLMILLLIVAFFSTNIFALQKAGNIMSIMGGKDGTVERLAKESATKGKILKEDDIIYFGDILITKDVMVKIVLTHYDDKPMVVMKSGTKIRLEKKKKYKKGGLFSFFGKLFFKGNGKDHRGFKIITSNAIAGIEGTKLSVVNNNGKTRISVYEGLVSVKSSESSKQKKLLRAGDTIVCGLDGVPASPQKITSFENWYGFLKSELPKKEEIEIDEAIGVEENPVETVDVPEVTPPVGKPVKGDLNDNGKIDSSDAEMAGYLTIAEGDKYLKLKLKGKDCNKHEFFLKSGELKKDKLEKYADMNNDGMIDSDDAKILEIIYRENYDINDDGLLNEDDVEALKEKAENNESTQIKLDAERLSITTLKNKITELKKLKYNPELRQ